MSERVRVGLIGCGAISGAYLSMAKNLPILEIAAAADLDLERARSVAETYGVKKACPVDELIVDESIEIVLNLTVPKAHLPVAMLAIEAGKHVYSEKPLGVSREEGLAVMAAATKKKLLVGCAPDTFMGAGLQTARKLLDDGAIGKPVAFTAFMMGPGHETWHPNPEFYYEVGAGPMLDMGPYYVTALLNLFGPVKRLSGLTSIAIPERTITSKPKAGKKIKVETPDHYTGSIEFESGAVGTIIQTFATYFPTYDGKHPITVYGTEGTMKVPDPNHFDGPVHIRKKDDADWVEMPQQFVAGYGRSVGLADMAYALRSGRPHRASGEQAMAALDVMVGFLDSSRDGRMYHPMIQYQRPAPMPANLPFGTLDD